MALLALAWLLILGACGTDTDGEEAQPAPPGEDPPAEEEADAPDPGDGPVRGGTLVIALDNEMTSWDPPDGLVHFAARGVNHGTFGSITAARTDGTYGPYLAESVEPNEDATVWTIVMREGLTFHDGTPLDAEAVKFNLDRTRGPDSDIAAGLALIEDVEVVDDLTVVVTLNEARATFDVTLADGPGNLVSPAAVEELGDEIGQSPVGAGPYQFVEWVRDDRLVVERYDGFFRDDVAWLDRIEYRPIIDDDARAAALRAGDVDMMYTQSPPVIRDFLDDPDFEVIEIPFGVRGMYINHAAAPTDDMRIRQALWHAIDPEALIDLVWDGIGEPTNSPVAPDSPWYEPVETPGYDPDAARALVEEYQADTGNDTSIEIMTTATPTNRAWAEALQAQLGQVGIDVSIVEVDANVFVTRLIEGDYQASTRTYGGFLDPWFEMTRLHTSDGFLNISNYATDEMDEMLEIGSTSTDFEERRAAYARVQEILAEGLEGVYFSTNTWAIIMRPYVQGYGSWTLPDGSPGLGNFFHPIVPDELWRADE